MCLLNCCESSFTRIKKMKGPLGGWCAQSEESRLGETRPRGARNQSLHPTAGASFAEIPWGPVGSRRELSEVLPFAMGSRPPHSYATSAGERYGSDAAVVISRVTLTQLVAKKNTLALRF
jgi:hypothetical protein